MHNMTQAEFGGRLNYSDKAVSKWDRGESVPDISVPVEIAELFGVTLDSLVKGGLGGFSKRTLAEPNSPAYIESFIIECNKGVLTHRLSYPIGFLAVLTLGGVLALTVALPVAAVNMLLNILPTLALGYNTPKLYSALASLKKKEERKKQASLHKQAFLTTKVRKT